MTREALIGTWSCRQTSCIYELHSDGSAAATMPGSQCAEPEQLEWEYVDASHWKLRTIIPPTPDAPGLEDGAIDVCEFEVALEEPDRMSLMEFDVEFPWVWERVRTGQ